MGVSVVQLLIYVLLIGVSVYCFCINHKKPDKWVVFVRQHLLLVVMLLAVNTISFGLTIKKKQDSYYIKRQSYDGDDKKYEFRIMGEGEVEDVDLVVSPKKLKPKEVSERMELAFKYLDEHLKGNNPSLLEITGDIDISLPHDEYPFDIEALPSDYLLIDEEGTVRNEESYLKAAGFTGTELFTGIKTGIKVILWYGEVKNEKEYELTIFPRKKNEWEKQIAAVTEFFERKNKEAEYEDGFELPAEYDGLEIISLDQQGLSPTGVLVIGFIMAFLIVVREAETKRKQKLCREQELMYAYPWFINEMVLMLGAGMQVKNIFSLMVFKAQTMKEDDHRRFLIEELKQAQHGFDIGMSEGRIYYELGRRLQLSCYIKIMSLLEQNVKKGSKGLVAAFEQEERNAFVERMNLAKKRGEEAGTKLLGPMILLLLIIMLMIMVPAFMSFT